jgi:hypothetical protein
MSNLDKILDGMILGFVVVFWIYFTLIKKYPDDKERR